MTKFNPDNKEILTYGETLMPAMEITDEADAKQYLKSYVEHIQKTLDENPLNDSMTAEEIAKTNLAYFAGYYSNETRERVERLFICSHPIFGSMKDNGDPTFKQALKAGKNFSK